MWQEKGEGMWAWQEDGKIGRESCNAAKLFSQKFCKIYHLLIHNRVSLCHCILYSINRTDLNCGPPPMFCELMSTQKM